MIELILHYKKTMIRGKGDLTIVKPRTKIYYLTFSRIKISPQRENELKFTQCYYTSIMSLL